MEIHVHLVQLQYCSIIIQCFHTTCTHDFALLYRFLIASIRRPGIRKDINLVPNFVIFIVSNAFR